MKKLLHFFWIFILSVPVFAQTPIHQFNFDGNATNTAGTNTLTTYNVFNGAGQNGSPNGSLYTNGSTSQIYGTLSDMPSGSSARTISIWARYINTSPANTSLFSHGSGSTATGNFRINVAPAASPSQTTVACQAGSFFMPSSFDVYSWHMYTFTYDGTAGKLYVDGDLVVNSNVALNTVASQFAIGNIWNLTGNQAHAYYDNLRIYDVALTQSQVVTLYSGTTTFAPTISSVTTSNITSNAATINYGINANGANATTVIRYGTSSGSLNQTYNCPSTSTTASFFETISGLSPSTTYFYKIESSNSAGTTITPTTYSFTTLSTASSITNGLVAYYGFENFNSHNGLHNLTPSASAPILDGIGGKVGLGARFESTNSQQLVNSSSLNTALDGTEFTICYWVNSQANTSGKAYPTHFEMFGSGFARQEQSLGYSNLNRGYADSATTFRTSPGVSNTGINLGWKHIAIVHKSGNTNPREFEVYVDGVLTSGFPVSTTVPVLYKLNSNFYIGGGGSSVKYFKGYIDEFYIYNRALDVTEINTVKDNTNAPLSASSFNNNLKFNLYPNPANDVVSISLDNELKSIEIYSLQGQKVLSSTQNQINVSDLTPGIYMVKIESINGLIATEKLMKK